MSSNAARTIADDQRIARAVARRTACAPLSPDARVRLATARPDGCRQ